LDIHLAATVAQSALNARSRWGARYAAVIGQSALRKHSVSQNAELASGLSGTVFSTNVSSFASQPSGPPAVGDAAASSTRVAAASPAAAVTASSPAARITPALLGSVDSGAAGSEVTDGSGTAGSARGFAGSCAAAAAMLTCTQTAATSVRSLRHKAVRVQQGKAQMWRAPARPASLLPRAAMCAAHTGAPAIWTVPQSSAVRPWSHTLASPFQRCSPRDSRSGMATTGVLLARAVVGIGFERRPGRPT